MAVDRWDLQMELIKAIEDMLTKEVQKIDSNLYAQYEPIGPYETVTTASIHINPMQPTNNSGGTVSQPQQQPNWNVLNGIPYSPLLQSSPAPNPIKLSTTAPEFYGTRAFFLVLDQVPEHIQKTFGFGEKDGALKHYTDCPVIRMGETINLGRNIEFAVIIYQASDWHADQAYQLVQQLKDLYPDLKVLSLAVNG